MGIDIQLNGCCQVKIVNNNNQSIANQFLIYDLSREEENEIRSLSLSCTSTQVNKKVGTKLITLSMKDFLYRIDMLQVMI